MPISGGEGVTVNVDKLERINLAGNKTAGERDSDEEKEHAAQEKACARSHKQQVGDDEARWQIRFCLPLIVDLARRLTRLRSTGW